MGSSGINARVHGVAVENNFDTLVAAVQAAGLVGALSGDGPLTVFAPTDAAFQALPDGIVDALLADTDTLTKVLLYHVVAGGGGGRRHPPEPHGGDAGGLGGGAAQPRRDSHGGPAGGRRLGRRRGEQRCGARDRPGARPGRGVRRGVLILPAVRWPITVAHLI